MEEEKIEYVVVKAADVGLALRRKSVVNAEAKANQQRFKKVEPVKTFEAEAPEESNAPIYTPEVVEEVKKEVKK